MIDVAVSPDARAALWAALPTRPVSWNAVPDELTLPGGTRLTRSDAPDGEMPHLMVVLHASEYLEDLTYGTGEYTDEELADPDAVIDAYWVQARALAQDAVLEAARVLGEPAERTPDARVQASWLLPDRTVSVGVTQADKDCPVEVCVWLLPPGVTALTLGL